MKINTVTLTLTVLAAFVWTESAPAFAGNIPAAEQLMNTAKALGVKPEEALPAPAPVAHTVVLDKKTTRIGPKPVRHITPKAPSAAASGARYKPSATPGDYNGDGQMNAWDDIDRDYDKLWNPDLGTQADYNGDGRANSWDEVDRNYDQIWNPDRGSPADYNNDGRADMWDQVDKDRDNYWKNK